LDCPCSFFREFETPSIVDVNNASNIEFGLPFKAAKKIVISRFAGG
jgi:hypothetical protein